MSLFYMESADADELHVVGTLWSHGAPFMKVEYPIVDNLELLCSDTILYSAYVPLLMGYRNIHTATVIRGDGVSIFIKLISYILMKTSFFFS